MDWWARYVGIPFVDGGRGFDGLDCWGLVRLIYAEQAGLELPLYGEISARDLAAVARAIRTGQDAWFEPERPAALDAVTMRLTSRSWVGHVGVMVDARRLIHIEEKTAAAVVPVDHFTVRDRIAGYRRHRDIA